MKPVIVLVGRPNVGKSTLFNRLTGGRDALVADYPGLTRDRLYGEGQVGGRPYLVVDTGGISERLDGATGASFASLMSLQTQVAVTEADAVILVTDGREGLSPVDREIAEDLRRRGKRVWLAVNKTEGMDGAVITAEFHALGLGAPYAISAAHGDGVGALLAQVLASLPAAEAAAEEVGLAGPRIAVAGRPNVGKSTLVNALLGEERVVVFDQPGTTRDSVRVPLERQGRRYVLIDTAGVRRRARIEDYIEKYSVVKTLQAIDEANVVILVLDAHQGISDQDAALAGFIVERGRALVIAVNKWDGLDTGARAQVRRELERKLPFVTFARVHYISALQGTGVGELFGSVDRAATAAVTDLPTSRLNRVLQAAVQAVSPPMIRGRRIKLKYAHQGGKNPPVVVIHGNQVESLPKSYRRYLENSFRRSFKLEGTPIRIELRQGENPYQSRRRSAKSARA